MSMFFTTPLLLLCLLLPINAQTTCPPGQASIRGICKLCPPGTFSTATDTICTPCPEGTFQPFHGAGLSVFCRPCSRGTFSNIQGATICKPCPPGKVSPPRSRSTCVFCQPGFGLKRSSCKQCRKAYYSLNNECVPCPNGLSSPKRSSSIDDCKPCEELGDCPRCNKNEYRVDNRCVHCPPGTITLRGRGATSITQCITCPAGTFRSRDRSINSDCRPCIRGFTSAPGAGMCRNPRKPCPEGTFEAKDRNCMSCQKGFRYDPIENTCTQCADDEVSPGGTNQECRKCPPDLVKYDFFSTCECPLGTFGGDDNECKKCPKGTFGKYIGADQCFLCPVGSFNDKRGQSSCRPCPEDQVSEKGAEKCMKCADGLVKPSTKSIGLDRFKPRQCVNITNHCPPGFVREGTGSSSVCRGNVCTSSTPVADIGKTCPPCARGTVLDESGSEPKCMECGKDSVSEGGLQTRCMKCKNGFVKDQFRPHQCICTGRAAERKGVQKGVCKFCPPGMIGDTRRVERNSTCGPCEAGTFKRKRRGYCESCDVDTFSTGGARVCTPCPEGYVTRVAFGATKASDCVLFRRRGTTPSRED